jgi:acyl-coenzyme A thioesterase PaaI-like protein
METRSPAAPVSTPESTQESAQKSARESAQVVAPFSAALALTPAEHGVYRAELQRAWTVGGGKVHGGFMLALLAKGALTGLEAHTGAPAGSAEPLSVSADFLRAPDTGPAALATEVVKVGRTASVVRVTLHQHGHVVLSGSVTAGTLPEGPAEWSDLPGVPAEPPAGARLSSETSDRVAPMARSCDVVLDEETASFARGERGEPLMRGWARPIGEEPDVLFALLCGDVLPPLLFNLGRPGWAPTVQLTALLRGRPAPGWLRIEAVSRVIRGGWFDEDYTVLDAAGQLVCQARQLALAPLS